MRTKIKIVRLIPFFMLTISSCGYNFPGGRGLPEGVDRILVEVLKNRTSESGVENIATRNLINEFVLREERSLARSIDEADAVLSGEVAKISIQTIAAKGKDSASQRRVTVEVDLKLTKKDGSVVWVAKRLSDNQAYPVSNDKNETETAKRVAIDEASRRIAERALNRLIGDF